MWHIQHKDFTYGELLGMGEKKLQSLYPEASVEDITEAMEIIGWFKEDVEEDFPEVTDES